MNAKWTVPEIISLNVHETADSTQPDQIPDGVFGSIFPDGEGTKCTLCS